MKRKKITITILIMILLSCSSIFKKSGSLPPLPPNAILSREAVLEDMEFIVARMVSVHPDFINGMTSRQIAYLAEIQEKIPESLTAGEAWFILNDVFKLLRDSHALLGFESLFDEILNLPLLWLSDGLYISRTIDNFSAGDRVIALNCGDTTLTSRNILNLLDAHISSENIYWVKSIGPPPFDNQFFS